MFKCGLFLLLAVVSRVELVFLGKPRCEDVCILKERTMLRRVRCLETVCAAGGGGGGGEQALAWLARLANRREERRREDAAWGRVQGPGVDTGMLQERGDAARGRLQQRSVDWGKVQKADDVCTRSCEGKVFSLRRTILCRRLGCALQ